MKRDFRHAFTLIELLVVIAIIGILSSLLLGVFGKAKSKARQIECLNDLKQLGLGAHLYADDNDDAVPRENGGNAVNSWGTLSATNNYDVWYNTYPPAAGRKPASYYADTTVPRLQEDLRVPITGVIEPGAQAAVKATRNGKVGVIGTRATVKSRAYERAIEELDKDIEVFAEACPLFVPLIEEGWLDDPVTDSVIARYLERLLRSGIDTLVLGCTHYPLLRDAIQRHVGPDVTLVDSAQNTALAVQKLLKQYKLGLPKKTLGKLRVALTDQSTGFLRVAEEALGLQVGDVQLRTVQAAI